MSFKTTKKRYYVELNDFENADRGKKLIFNLGGRANLQVKSYHKKL
jgi:hypothetical protein